MAFRAIEHGFGNLLQKVGSRVSLRSRIPNGGSLRIAGSFPSYEKLHATGKRDDYYIQDGYQSRAQASYYNDLSNTDGWQDEVYRFAREVADEFSLSRITDVGCGSGFKLLKYFSELETLGLDVEETRRELIKKYPNRRWELCDFMNPAPPESDLVINSDVIEHVLDPDVLLDFICRLKPKLVVLSTPDRNLLRTSAVLGPPVNPSHIREWTMAELHRYLEDRFEILAHFHSNPAQATQCALLRPKS